MIGLAEISTEILRRDRSEEQLRRLLMRPDDSGEKGFAFKRAESLRGGLSRAFARAGLTSSWLMLKEVGLKHRNRVLVSEDTKLDIAALAEGLQVPRDQILERRYPEVAPGVREFFGLQIASSYIKTRTRHFSPTFLKDSKYHHAAWELKFLPFCPETFDMLQSTCTICRPDEGQVQGWIRTLTPVDCCDECGRRLGYQPVQKVPEEMQPSLNIIARIVSPDLTIRQTFTEFVPSQLKTNSPQQTFDVIIGLARHVAIPEGRRYEDERLVRLHLACEAVNKWPNGIDNLDFTVSKKGAILPSLMRRYAALGAESPSNIGKAALAGANNQIAQEGGPVLGLCDCDQLVGLSKACQLAGLSYDLVDKVWNSGFVTRRYRFHGTTLFPAVDMRELMLIANTLKRRMSTATVSYQLGISNYGIEQCALLDVIPSHMLSLSDEGYHFHSDEIEQLLQNLQRRSVTVSGNLISVRDALRKTAGGVKPWGHILKELLEGRIPFQYHCDPERKLSEWLLVSATDMTEYLPDLMQNAASGVGDLSSLVSQRDASEILNCSNAVLGMLDDIKGQGINPILYPLKKVIARSQECIATFEVVDRLNMAPAAAHCLLRDAGVIQVVPGGWHRGQTEALIACDMAAQRAQTSLFRCEANTTNKPNVERFIRNAGVRGGFWRSNVSKHSNNSALNQRVHRPQLSLDL